MDRKEYLQKKKNLFDSYRQDRSNKKIYKRLQRELEQYASKGLWMKRGKKDVPLMEQAWFTEEKQKDFISSFTIQIILWLNDTPLFSEINFNKKLKVPPYDSFIDNSWYEKVMYKIFDNIKYAFKSKNLFPSLIVEGLKEKFHIIEPISTVGKIGVWQSEEAFQYARRLEMRLIKKIEGQKDLKRKLKQIDDIAEISATEKENEVLDYIKEHGGYRVVWTWMLRHPESPLWYLLGIMNPEDFELFFLNFLQMDFKTPTIKDVDEAIITEQIIYIKERFSNYTYEEIADVINQTNKDIFIDSRKAKYLWNKEQNRLIKNKKGKTVYCPEVEFLKKIHHFATDVNYLKSKIEVLRNEIKEQKEYKEFTEMPEPPPSLFAWEDFVKDTE